MPKKPHMPVKDGGSHTEHACSAQQYHISKDTPIEDILHLIPDAAPLFAEYGLHCAGCALSGVDSLEVGCTRHGYGNEVISELVDELNRLLEYSSKLPRELSISYEAAIALKQFKIQEGEERSCIVVEKDDDGMYTLNFHKEKESAWKAFFHPSVPELTIFASESTLTHARGAVVNMKDGVFTLELPKKECACSKKECGCKRQSTKT
jgi:hybrid cluster-associated redox disulfide protein